MTTETRTPSADRISGRIPVTDVDQVFPLLTTEHVAGSPPGPATGDQGSAVEAVLRDVLGWRPRTADTAAFAAALKASFTLTEVEGHVEATYVPRGFAMQADLGAVSGGQASLYSRARSAHAQITGLLDGLTALRVDSDPEDCAAYRALVRHAVSRLVDELGTPGGPRAAVVESAFTILAGADSEEANADTVVGQLGSFRERFGLIDANVNTVEEERVRTSFWTLVDLVLDLRRSWNRQRGPLGSGAGSGFLGTDYVILSRLLAAAAEQVEEVEAVLNSVLVAASERQTIELGSGTGLTLDGLLRWLRQFLTEDGPTYIRESGRDGMLTAFAPTAKSLLDTLTDEVLSQLAPPTSSDGTLRLIPNTEGSSFPTGMFAARTWVALTALGQLLTNVFSTASKIGRFPGIVLYEVEIAEVAAATEDSNGLAILADQVVTLRGSNIRPTLTAAIFFGGEVFHPEPGSTTTSADTMSGRYSLPRAFLDSLTSQWLGSGVPVVVPASSLEIAVWDSETGDVVKAPAPRRWTRLRPAVPGTAVVVTGTAGSDGSDTEGQETAQ